MYGFRPGEDGSLTTAGTALGRCVFLRRREGDATVQASWVSGKEALSSYNASDMSKMHVNLPQKHTGGVIRKITKPQR